MKVLYRISEGSHSKQKPSYVYDKKLMFQHFMNRFQHHDIYVFADHVSDDLYAYLQSRIGKKNQIERIELGNSKSFLHTVAFAIRQFTDDDIVYFAEDDYLYVKNADQILEEGLMIADYCSGYDHPDKYINYEEDGENPCIEEGGEWTRVIMTANSHWKWTNSCCMTFATRVKTLKEDLPIYFQYCMTNVPNDFGLFSHLIRIKKKKLVSCIPSVSTHGESKWLAKLIPWDQVFWESIDPNSIQE